MKLKFMTVIVVLAAALFSGVVLWRVDRFVYGDRMAWAESQARSQMSSLTQAINAEIKSGRRMLSTVTSDTFKPESTNWRAFQPYYTLALMTSQNGTMSITRMVTKPDSPGAGWNAVQLTQQLGFLGKELDSKSVVILRAFKDAQKQRHVALIFAGGGTAYILVGGGENFQGLIDSQKGSMSSFAIMASDGLTISHPIPDYIGNVMSDSTMLKEIRNSGAAQGVGTYMQGSKKVFGMYERVAGTNSYVISTVPIEDLLRGRLSLAWQFVFLALALSSFGTAFYVWYMKKRAVELGSTFDEDMPAPTDPPKAIPPKAMTPAATATAATATAPQYKPALPASHAAAVVVSNSALVAPSAPRTASAGLTAVPEEAPQDKAEAYRQVASALGQEMRAPIASIVGFSQMVLSKTQDPDVVQAVESILREARSSRDVLEMLHTFSGDRHSEKIEEKIEGPIAQALKKFENTLRDKGVAVEKDFKQTTPWPLAHEDMVKVFENLFSNAIEAMERMQDKKLKISVWEDEQGLHVQVADSGEGVAPENLAKVFEPFYTTRSFAHHVGLGLPVVIGILKEHHAEVQLKSIRGQGTQVEMLFSPLAKTASPRVPKAPPPPPAPRPSPLPVPAPAAAAPVSEDTDFSIPAPPPSAAPSLAPAAKTSRLTDVNVDRLLDISSDDMPLEFLDGMGFDEDSDSVRKPPVPVMPSKAEALPPSKPKMPPPPIQAADSEQVPVSVQEPEPVPEDVSTSPAEPAEPPRFVLEEEDVDSFGFMAVPVTSGPLMPPPTPPPSAPPPPSMPPQFQQEETGPLYKTKAVLEEAAAEAAEELEVSMDEPKASLPVRAPAILPEDELPLETHEALNEVMEPTVVTPPSVVIDKPTPRNQSSHSALDSYKVEIRRPGKRI